MFDVIAPFVPEKLRVPDPRGRLLAASNELSGRRPGARQLPLPTGRAIIYRRRRKSRPRAGRVDIGEDVCTLGGGEEDEREGGGGGGWEVGMEVGRGKNRRNRKRE